MQPLEIKIEAEEDVRLTVPLTDVVYIDAWSFDFEFTEQKYSICCQNDAESMKNDNCFNFSKTESFKSLLSQKQRPYIKKADVRITTQRSKFVIPHKYSDVKSKDTVQIYIYKGTDKQRIKRSDLSGPE